MQSEYTSLSVGDLISQRFGKGKREGRRLSNPLLRGKKPPEIERCIRTRERDEHHSTQRFLPKQKRKLEETGEPEQVGDEESDKGIPFTVVFPQGVRRIIEGLDK